MTQVSRTRTWSAVLYSTVSHVFHRIFTSSFASGDVRPVSPRRIVRRVLYTVLVAVGAVGMVFATVIFGNVMWAMGTPMPAFGVLENRIAGDSTKLYDRTGTVLLYDTAGAMRRTTIPLRDISPYLQHATIAIEDASFYTHPGVRYDAIARAFLSNIKSGSLDQGGSTITQQLIKNTLLTSDKLWSRKIKEFVLALRIEQTYTKEEILETYLNQTPYGGTIYGAEEASRAYFNVSAKELTLSQSAYIAALPKAPTYYSPWGAHPEALEKRHTLVLKEMLRHRLISEREYQSALLEDVTFVLESNENIKAPHFVFYVLDELEKKYGTKKVYDGQLRIITTLDWEMQKESEKIIHDGALLNEAKFHASNAALVAIDPQSGQILSMVGSRNYFDDTVDGQVNVATAHRQPGSAFKPFVYATAFKKGYTPDTILFDLKTQFSTACAPSNFSNEDPCYAPDNYDEKFRGPMTIRDALAQSVNIVGVKALYLGGIEESLATARSLGITTLTDAKRYGLTLVLGGGEVTLLEMTGAYGAFANDGIWNQPTPILTVFAENEVLESYKETSKRVFEPEIAQAINDILSDNEARTPAFGSNSPLHFNYRVVASKTGTTNDYRDAWVIGYTPSIVVGTWAGNSDNTPMVKSVASFILAPMWHNAMETAMAHFPFEPLKTLTRDTSLASTSTLVSSFYDPRYGVHEILYWMHRNDAKGVGTMQNPYDDQQIAQWGYPVALWAMEQARFALASGTPLFSELAFGIGGRDDVPLQMSIATPERGAHLQSGVPYTMTITHSEIENVLQVSYYVQGVYVGETREYPFSFTFIPEGEGVAVLRAVAESPLGNKEALTTIVVGSSERAERRMTER